MIAKIGYAFAFAEGATTRPEGRAAVIPAILGESKDIGRWVRTLPEPFVAHPGILHRLVIHEDVKNRFLWVEVQLFADSQTPSYGVILGNLKSP
jgi:hypothetical protein